MRFDPHIRYIYPFYEVYGLFGFHNLLFATINLWKMHPQSLIFYNVSAMKSPIYSRSSKSLLDI
jgi:hypothetical protein